MKNYKLSEIVIYTDGSSKKIGDHLFGGWAYEILKDEKVLRSDSGSADSATNQQMELKAAIESLNFIKHRRDIDEKVVLYSDSAYLINCWQQEWWINWQRNGWVNAKKQPVANQELWLELIPFFENKNYEFRKVKGHDTNIFNDDCDKLAQAAAEELKSRWRGTQNG